VDAQAAALAGIDGLRKRTLLFAVLALIGFLWTGSGLFGAIEEAFAVVFGTGTRPFLRQKLMALAMMGCFAVLALLAVGTSALLPLLGNIPGFPLSPGTGPLGFAVRTGVGVASGFLLFFAIYYVVPNRHIPASRVWPGALFAAVAFELLSGLFPLYVRINQDINRYGQQFAFLFVLLTFFYLLGLITMLGAEIIAELDRPAPRRAGAR
jgi:membrane protein